MLRISLAFLLCIPAIAIGLEAEVKGMGKMQQYYTQLIAPGATRSAPFPKLYILDTQTGHFLDMDQLYTLLEQSEKTRGFDSIFTVTEQQVSNEVLAKLAEDNHSRYIAFYFNAPDDAMEMIESLLAEIEATHLTLDKKITAHPQITYYKNF